MSSTPILSWISSNISYLTLYSSFFLLSVSCPIPPPHTHTHPTTPMVPIFSGLLLFFQLHSSIGSMQSRLLLPCPVYNPKWSPLSPPFLSSRTRCRVCVWLFLMCCWWLLSWGVHLPHYLSQGVLLYRRGQHSWAMLAWIVREYYWFKVLTNLDTSVS